MAELKQLQQEFEVHQSAGAGLEGAFGRRHRVALPLDPAPHGPHRGSLGLGERGAIKEVGHEGLEFRRWPRCCHHDPCAGKQLSFPCLGGTARMVSPQYGGSGDERPRVTVRPQAQVGLEDRAERSAVAHQLLQRADHGFRRRGVGLLGDEQEVEIGPEGQFGSAVFSQRDQQKFSLRVELSQHPVEHRIGQQREAGLHLLDAPKYPRSSPTA